jgi:hypothetical protein
MASEWAEVDTLIRELGAVRSAADAARASATAKAAIDQALAEATEAVVDTLDAPGDAQVIARAHDAIEVVADVMATLDEDLVRSLRVRARGATLRRRAQELIAQGQSS